MSELDDKWSEMLLLATERARADGRAGVADYLELRAVNDAVREASVTWLVDSLVEIAMKSDRFSVQRVEPHSFQLNTANIVGTMLQVRQGVRCLTIEAGWPRTPTDGFMRGAALAMARIVHFGSPRDNVQLNLIRRNDDVVWVIRDSAMQEAVFNGDSLRMHFNLFADA